jgi:hypothetical protein
MPKKLSSNYIIRTWQKHQFKILVFTSVLCICVLYTLNDPTKGTWSLEYSYNPRTNSIKYVKESKGEHECRRVLEKLFSRPFPNIRPLFLMNVVTGKPLEIDCCNLDLKLGVEYNGRQHYEYTKGMHKNFEAFRIQQYRDEMKKQKCKENNFNLVVVPYTISVNFIENYLIEELRMLGYNL